MPAADVSIAHLLIHPTIPLPRPGPRRPPCTTDWRSSTATAGWQWQAAAAGARGALWSAARASGARPAMASSSDARQTTVVPPSENKFLPYRRGGRAEE